MKKYYSVFALFAGATFKKLMAVILTMGIIETGMFWYLLQNADEHTALEDLTDTFSLRMLFLLSFVLYVTLLGTSFAGQGTNKTAYTTSRLSISELSVSWIHVLYNFCAVTVFYAAQIGIAMIFYLLYQNSGLGGEYQHTLVMAFYRSDALHGLLPLADKIGYISILMLFASISISIAIDAKQARCGRKFGFFGMSTSTGCIVFLFINGTLIFENGFIGLIFLGLLGGLIYCLIKGGDLDAYEEPENTAQPV